MGDIELYGTPAEQLKTVNEAIYAVLRGGQKYRIGTRQMERADLATLYRMQQQLQGELADTGEKSLFDDTYVGIFDGR